MSKLVELQDERKALLAEAKAIDTAANAVSRDLSEQEIAKIEASTARVDEIDLEISKLEAVAKTRSRISELEDAGKKPVSEPKAVSAATPKIEVGAPAIENDPKKGFKNSAEFYIAVQKNQNGPNGDERLEFLAAAGSDEHRTVSDPAGGYLVPEAFVPSLLEVDPESDWAAGRTQQIPMGAPTVHIPARVDKNHTSSVAGGITAEWTAETASRTASNQTYETVSLNANTLSALAYVTDELMMDSPISMSAILNRGFNQAITDKIIDARLNGTGVGQPLGILNSDATITVAKETGQAADTITYDNIVKMRARAWGYQNAIWTANYDVIPQLATMNQTVGTAGVPAWQPSAREDISDLLFGRPIVFTEYAETVGNKGDIVLANWQEYLEGIYMQGQSSESVHVRFLNNERAFKFNIRMDGRPWWKTAFTPKKGSTLSPFVTLAARA